MLHYSFSQICLKGENAKKIRSSEVFVFILEIRVDDGPTITNYFITAPHSAPPGNRTWEYDMANTILPPDHLCLLIITTYVYLNN